jgi:hypothetical protein
MATARELVYQTVSAQEESERQKQFQANANYLLQGFEALRSVTGLEYKASKEGSNFVRVETNISILPTPANELGSHIHRHVEVELGSYGQVALVFVGENGRNYQEMMRRSQREGMEEILREVVMISRGSSVFKRSNLTP